jgi:subtilisin family serine protease
MKNFKLLVFLSILLFVQLSFAQKADKTYVDGEVLVKFKNGTVSQAAVDSHRNIAAKVLEQFADLSWQRVKLPSRMSVTNGMSYYRKLSEIADVQPNFYYHLEATPNDTQYSTMYGLPKISAPQAWDLSTGSSSIVVADIDTGMNYNHTDLAPNAWTNTGEIPNNNIDDDGNGYVDDYYGYDFYFNDSNPIDENGHGTHTAGTIGAVGNNNQGVTGVNWNVKLMPIKIYDSVGTTTTSAMLINAYNYIRIMKNRGVNIVATNNSYGGCNEACGYDQATKDALDALGDVGVLQAFAAGNNGTNNDTTPFYPASYTSPSIIAVASSTSTDARSSFSCFGATSVDLAAPGSSILSTVMSGGYGTLSGTSMATPHVAGAAALLKSYNSTLSSASLKASLMNRVDQLSAWNGVVKTNGRMNVFSAMQTPTVCDFQLANSSQSVGITGGSVNVNATAGTNCDYSVKSNDSWITVSSGNPSSGNATISLTVAQNTSGADRSGTVKIADKTFTVNQSGPLAPRTAPIDFDGDGKTDYAVTQNSAGQMLWHIQRSQSGYLPVNFGLATDTPIPVDFDGDRKTDVGVYRVDGTNQGYFYYLRSIDNVFQSLSWGTINDFSSNTQDFDGDGKADFTVIRKTSGQLIWYVLKATGSVSVFQFGIDTDKPIRGDFDGDSKADLAVYRPSANSFYYLRSSDNAFVAMPFGISSTDKIIPADFDGDGKTDIAVWRTTNGTWYWLNSSNGSFSAMQFGISTDLPIPGDYDGDGKTDQAVWRPDATSSVNYVQQSTAGFSAFGWGNSTMQVPSNLMQVR